MDDFKGNLRNGKELIMKNRIRQPDGQPIHKSEFSTNDKPSLFAYLTFLKDKCGVNMFEFKDKYKRREEEEIRQAIEEERQGLDEWREKTKGLREPDKEFREKAKKLL